MDKPFRGRFETKIDSKGRLSFPKALHATLSDLNPDIVITNSQFRGSRNLDVYSLKEWQKLEERIAKLPQLKAEVQEFRRFYLASGQPIGLDTHNRILIPSTLRKYAGLQGDVVLVGMGEKLEIWSADVWQQMFSQLASGFEQTLSSVASLEEGGE